LERIGDKVARALGSTHAKRFPGNGFILLTGVCQVWMGVNAVRALTAGDVITALGFAAVAWAIGWVRANTTYWFGLEKGDH